MSFIKLGMSLPSAKAKLWEEELLEVLLVLLVEYFRLFSEVCILHDLLNIRRSSFGFHREHPLDKASQVLINLIWQDRDLIIESWEFSEAEKVKDDAHGIYVSSASFVWHLLSDLWSHVLPCNFPLAKYAIEGLNKTHVAEFERTFACDENVFELQVEVGHLSFCM